MDLVNTFLKHAVVAGFSVGIFATLLEKWSVNKSAYFYAAQPLGFLYLIITCILSRSRTESPKFTMAVIKGNIVWSLFVLVWWFTDTNSKSFALPFISSVIVWILLFALFIKQKWV